MAALEKQVQRIKTTKGVGEVLFYKAGPRTIPVAGGFATAGAKSWHLTARLVLGALAQGAPACWCLVAIIDWPPELLPQAKV